MEQSSRSRLSGQQFHKYNTAIFKLYSAKVIGMTTLVLSFHREFSLRECSNRHYPFVKVTIKSCGAIINPSLEMIYGHFSIDTESNECQLIKFLWTASPLFFLPLLSCDIVSLKTSPVV